MKDSIYNHNKTGPPRFDNPPEGLIVHWMNLSTLKAIRGFVAILGLAFLAGCETTANSDTVPKRNAAAEPTPLLIAQSAPAPASNPPAAVAAAPATDPSTNAPVEIKEVIPPSAPANLKLTDGVEKVIK